MRYPEAMAGTRRPGGDSRLIYSTDGGRVVEPAHPQARRGPRAPGGAAPPPDDGVVRIARAKRAGGGKTAMAVTGLPGGEAELDAILRRCKASLGVGGSREGRVLFVQGEQRERLQAALESLGFKAKLAGG